MRRGWVGASQPVNHRSPMGAAYDGTYTVQSKVVTVESIYGAGSTQVGGLPALAVARVLLHEIVAGAKRLSSSSQIALATAMCMRSFLPSIVLPVRYVRARNQK
jgi:hypothetical protein